MVQANRQLVKDFFVAIAGGNLPDELVTPDITFWSVNSGTSDRARFHSGLKMLASIFGGTLVYNVKALTAEEDRVCAEVESQGTLPDGELFDNRHVFLFRIRDGRIASAAEFMDQFVVREKILPLMRAGMAKSSAWTQS